MMITLTYKLVTKLSSYKRLAITLTYHLLTKTPLVLLFFIYSSTLYAVTLSVGSDYPIGVHAEVGLPFASDRFYARARYARFLSPYIKSMNSLSEDFDFYNSATSDIISAILKNANYFEIGAGWQQSSLSGWSAEISYAFVSGDGEVTGSQLAEAVSGVSLPAGTNIYQVSGELQMIGVSGGYKWPLNEKSALSFRLGVQKPIQSETQLDRDTSGPAQEALLKAANTSLDDYLKDVFKNDVYIPIIGVNWIYFFEL